MGSYAKYISGNNKIGDHKILWCSNFNHVLRIYVMAWSVVFKVSVQVHRFLYYGKYRLEKYNFWLSVVMHPVIKKEAPKTGRDEYEGVGVAVDGWPYRFFFNKHRLERLSLSDRICVNESFSRWYSLGYYQINLGLSHHVQMDCKSDSGCKIQDNCFGSIIVMMKLKLVKGKAVYEAATAADGNSPAEYDK